MLVASVLTFCICQAERRGVQAAGLPGPRGQTDGPTPARAGPALGLGQRHVGVWRLVKDLGVQNEISQHSQWSTNADSSMFLHSSSDVIYGSVGRWFDPSPVQPTC